MSKAFNESQEISGWKKKKRFANHYEKLNNL